MRCSSIDSKDAKTLNLHYIHSNNEASRDPYIFFHTHREVNIILFLLAYTLNLGEVL